MPDEGERGIEHLESNLREIENREYERSVAASVRLDGSQGTISIRRTYEALPFHNDELEPHGPDSNDEFLDRPDAVHVHTRYYRPDEDGMETYFMDRHEIWRLLDPSALGDAEEFRAACERHHLADLQGEYAWATDATARQDRPRSELEPEGWERLDSRS